MTPEMISAAIEKIVRNDGTIWESNVPKKIAISRIADYIWAVYGALPNIMPDTYFADACSKVIKGIDNEDNGN